MVPIGTVLCAEIGLVGMLGCVSVVRFRVRFVALIWVIFLFLSSCRSCHIIVDSIILAAKKRKHIVPLRPHSPGRLKGCHGRLRSIFGWASG